MKKQNFKNKKKAENGKKKKKKRRGRFESVEINSNTPKLKIIKNKLNLINDKASDSRKLFKYEEINKKDKKPAMLHNYNFNFSEYENVKNKKKTNLISHDKNKNKKNFKICGKQINTLKPNKIIIQI